MTDTVDIILDSCLVIGVIMQLAVLGYGRMRLKRGHLTLTCIEVHGHANGRIAFTLTVQGIGIGSRVLRLRTIKCEVIPPMGHTRILHAPFSNPVTFPLGDETVLPCYVETHEPVSIQSVSLIVDDGRVFSDDRSTRWLRYWDGTPF